MHRSIILALLAAAAVQATPLNLYSRPENDLIGDTGVSAAAHGDDSTISVRLAKRSAETSINNDLDLGLIARKNDDVDVKESQQDEELIGPFDIDGILPVNVVNI
ncbi:uncharacterized protein N7496_010437 [Penicillium cataractarum]|uniref:Uncharacterized protein n=1 Tax=Penicillium cataractarum TaxID=2100454 RepID=A0A9W9RSZ3_9EURO|nr:uncharacterized protein N7496_010437 [Penicillium cataractarum]KAJ5364724.1 hypothetical protein N7496_010437 [Penicillium cataractarum]